MWNWTHGWKTRESTWKFSSVWSRIVSFPIYAPVLIVFWVSPHSKLWRIFLEFPNSRTRPSPNRFLSLPSNLLMINWFGVVVLMSELSAELCFVFCLFVFSGNEIFNEIYLFLYSTDTFLGIRDPFLGLCSGRHHELVCTNYFPSPSSSTVNHDYQLI